MLQLPPCDIKFSQKSISNFFQDRRFSHTVNETIQLIKDGVYRVNQFRQIRVVQAEDGSFISLDNRRLYIFRVLQVEQYLDSIPVRLVPLTREDVSKFTTVTQGRSIKVRGEGNITLPHSVCSENIRKPKKNLANWSSNQPLSIKQSLLPSPRQRQPFHEVTSHFVTSPSQLEKQPANNRTPIDQHHDSNLYPSSSANQISVTSTKPEQLLPEVTSHSVTSSLQLNQQPINYSKIEEQFTRISVPPKPAFLTNKVTPRASKAIVTQDTQPTPRKYKRINLSPSEIFFSVFNISSHSADEVDTIADKLAKEYGSDCNIDCKIEVQKVGRFYTVAGQLSNISLYVCRALEQNRIKFTFQLAPTTIEITKKLFSTVTFCRRPGKYGSKE